MYRIARTPIFSLAVLLALVLLSACRSADETPVPGANVPGISISLDNSNCPGVEIKRNDQITWTNGDTVEHPVRVEFPDGKVMIDLGVLQPGDSASVTFPESGSYNLFCAKDQAAPSTISVLP